MTISLMGQQGLSSSLTGQQGLSEQGGVNFLIFCKCGQLTRSSKALLALRLVLLDTHLESRHSFCGLFAIRRVCRSDACGAWARNSKGSHAFGDVKLPSFVEARLFD
jgi:hypothetical protein